MAKHYLTINGVKRDEYGNHYLDVSSAVAMDEGVFVLIPLMVMQRPNKVASSVNSASAAATTPTTSDLRDVLSEADAILLDSSTDSTRRMNASSSESVAGIKSKSKSDCSTTLRANHESGTFALSLLFLLFIVAVSFAIGMIVGKF